MNGEELTITELNRMANASDAGRRAVEELRYLRQAIALSRAARNQLYAKNTALLALLAAALDGLDEYWVTTDHGAPIVAAIERETGLTYRCD